MQPDPKKRDPYARFAEEEIILRDYLAVDRTVLANERTFLSYVRTALAFAAGGVTLIHFFDSAYATVTGYVLLPMAAIVFVVGIQRFLYYRRRLRSVELK